MAGVLLHGQVVFSKRSYSERGRSYHQLWTWNAEDGSAKALTHSARNHFRPSCQSASQTVTFYSGAEPYDERDLWSFDRATGVERRVLRRSAPQAPKRLPVVGCESSAWLPDHSRGACAVAQDIVFYDAAQAAISGRVHFTAAATSPEVVAWSDDGRWLLVRTMGANDNSTVRQSDYFVLNTATNTWTTAGSGNDALWIPHRDQVLYSSPRDLTPLSAGSKHGVWTSQLVVFDPVTGARREVTHGTAYNIQPAACQ
jgi:hypothetical protein